MKLLIGSNEVNKGEKPMPEGRWNTTICGLITDASISSALTASVTLGLLTSEGFSSQEENAKRELRNIKGIRKLKLKNEMEMIDCIFPSSQSIQFQLIK